VVGDLDEADRNLRRRLRQPARRAERRHDGDRVTDLVVGGGGKFGVRSAADRYRMRLVSSLLE
jgi:hypothetical protein